MANENNTRKCTLCNESVSADWQLCFGCYVLHHNAVLNNQYHTEAAEWEVFLHQMLPYVDKFYAYGVWKDKMKFLGVTVNPCQAESVVVNTFVDGFNFNNFSKSPNKLRLQHSAHK